MLDRDRLIWVRTHLGAAMNWRAVPLVLLWLYAPLASAQRIPREFAAVGEPHTFDELRFSGTLAQPRQQADSAPREGCLRGWPLPGCRSFWITEFEWDRPLTRTEDPNMAVWRLGHMWNFAGASAVGGALTFELAGPRYGVLARYRRWIGPSLGVDLSPGVFVKHGQVGFTGQAALTFADAVGLTSRIDVSERPLWPAGAARQVSWWVGAKLGAKPGILVGTIGPAALVLGAIICFGVGACTVGWA